MTCVGLGAFGNSPAPVAAAFRAAAAAFQVGVRVERRRRTRVAWLMRRRRVSRVA